MAKENETMQIINTLQADAAEAEVLAAIADQIARIRELHRLARERNAEVYRRIEDLAAWVDAQVAAGEKDETDSVGDGSDSDTR